MGNWPVPVPNLGPRRKHWLNSLVVISSSMFKLTPNRAENLLQFAICDCKLLTKISGLVPRCRAWWPPLCTRTLMWQCTLGGGGTSWASAKTTGEGLGNLLLAEDKKNDAHWSGMRWSRRQGRRRWTTGTFRSAGRPRWQVVSQIQVIQDESKTDSYKINFC